MCQLQTIPRVNRIERLRAILAAAEETSEEGQDIFALDGRNVGSNEEVVDAMNHIITMLDVPRIEESLLNQGRIRIPYTLPSDYEDVFTLPGLSGRTARPINTNDPNPISGEQLLLVEDWANMCLENPSEDMDELLLGDMTAFQVLMEHGMPARLTLDSWIGKTLLNIVAESFPFDDYNDCFVIWEPSIGYHRFSFGRDSNGQLVTMINFIGVAEPGRIVWAPKIKHFQPIGLGHGLILDIEKTVVNAEAALVALARRVARYVATSIIHGYAAPKAEERGYDILTTKQIADAVREILGDEWFDLPFDVDFKLRNWSEEDVWTAEEKILG